MDTWSPGDPATLYLTTTPLNLKSIKNKVGKNNPAFNICIIYYMGIYSGTNHQIVASTLSLSGNGALNDSLDCSRHVPDEILKYITWKGKLPASTLGEDEALL